MGSNELQNKAKTRVSGDKKRVVFQKFFPSDKSKRGEDFKEPIRPSAYSIRMGYPIRLTCAPNPVPKTQGF
jgi:hypothetical protein